MVSPIHIQLFGAPQIERDGQPILIPRRKSLALLAYLAVTSQMQSRETLATLFWPNYDQSSALANLRRDLSRLKELFGENMLTADRLHAGLDSRVEMSLDVTVFRALVKKTKKHAHTQENLCGECFNTLTEAVEIYRGDFMAGFNLPNSPGFDEWQFFQGEELRQLLADALQRLINWHVSKGEYERASFMPVAGFHWTGFTSQLTAP
jgi:DNA-binding SARP family transcriptional activator